MNLRIKGNAEITIDDADVGHLGDFTWEVLPTGFVGAYATDPDGNPTIHLLHRRLLYAPTGWIVTHRNGNKLDNRRANLTSDRYSPYRARRKGPNSNCTSGVRGVQHVPVMSPKRPWRAQLGAGRFNYHLGLFATKEEAIAARRAAELCFWGDTDE